MPSHQIPAFPSTPAPATPLKVPTFHPDPENPQAPIFPAEDDDEEEIGVPVFHDPPKVVQNRHIGERVKTKVYEKAIAAKTAVSSVTPLQAGRGVKATVGPAMTIGQHATSSTGTIAAGVALTGGAAISATGIGLAAGAAAATVVTMGLSAVSAVKTASHLQGLQELYDARASFTGSDNCAEVVEDGVGNSTGPAQTSAHDIVANQVLPYVMHKKTSKLARKIIGTVGGSAFTTGYGVVKRVYKTVRKTRGVNRDNAAKWLASHFLSCNCKLSNAIIVELFSEKEMQAFASYEFDKLWPELKKKFSSTT